MTDKQEDHVIMLSNVRLAFPNLFTAQAGNNGEGKAAFSASFLMPPDHPDIAKLKAAISAVANAKWGEKANEVLTALVAGDKVCLHNGATKAQYDGYAGNMFVSSRGYQRPLVINADKSALAETDGKPYSGCYVNAQVAIWAQQNNHGKRVNAQLRGVQFFADGEAFGGGAVSDADDFGAVDSSADGAAPEFPDADDPMGLL
jgi:hypothetical protein